MKYLFKNSLAALANLSKIVAIFLVSMVWITPASAHIMPAGCTGSGLGISLFSNVSQVHIGDVISYSVVVFNGASGGILVCDATSITATLVTPDGAAHPITLVRTALSDGEFDSYVNIVNYTARAVDIAPDGTLKATASDSGSIHQNVFDSSGGSNQGLNVTALNTLHIIKLVVNDNGGTSTSSDFLISVKKGGVDVSGSPAPGVAGTGTLYSVIAGTYVVSEPATSSYAVTYDTDCSAGGSITLAAGEDKICTVTNNDVAPTLKVTKVVVNDSGGSKVVADFPLFVSSSAVVSGVTTTLALPGTYTVSETGDPNYTATFSGDCDASGNVTLALGDKKFCTITNNDIPGTIKVITVVVNDSGGSKTIADFPLFVSSSPVVSGVTNTFSAPASYVASETSDPNYTQTFSGDCDAAGLINLLPGQNKVCTITNNDIPGTIKVIKVVVNNSGGTKTVADFPLFVSSSPVVSGVTNTFSAPATYIVSETNDPNYTAAFSGDCDTSGHLTLLPGNHLVCTITNDDIPPAAATIKVVVVVINNSGGGTKTVADFPPFVNGAPVNSGATNIFPAPLAYTATETSDPNYTETFSGDCDSSGHLNLAPGDNKVCTITNDDIAPPPSGGGPIVGVPAGGGGGFTPPPPAAVVPPVVAAAIVPFFPSTGAVVTPVIYVTKVPNPTTLPAGGGLVTYTEKVTNPGAVAISNVTLVDDTCAPVKYVSGDTNGDTMLDTFETWIYTCTTKVSKTTSNTATAQGAANGQVARASAGATVTVAVPSFPNTGFAPREGTTSRNIFILLASIVAVVSISFLIGTKKRTL